MTDIRPIDANALFDALRDNEFQTLCPLDEVDDVIVAAPTLDYAPVRHGEWIKKSYKYAGETIYGYKCNNCGRVELSEEPFCNCGCKMDGGKKDG